MLEQKDIEQAKKLFKEWDNSHKWAKPSPEFVEHCRKKARDALSLAVYLLEKTENTKDLENNETITIWIVTTSYYSMFFEVEYLLGLDGKKLPEGTQDTHKTTYLAFLYYFIIKGSELEQNNFKKLTTTRMSKALAMFRELQDETLEIQRIKKSVRDLKSQREQRNVFTYKMSKSAEVFEAKKAIKNATEFRQLIEEYVLAKKS